MTPRRHGALATLALAGGLLAGAGCGDDGDDDPTEVAVTYVVPPPETIALGDPIAVTFDVATQGELHVAILRGCLGQVADCGLEAFDVEGYADLEAGGPPYAAAIVPDEPGTWTVVVYVHVDEDPHRTELAEVEVTAPI